MPATERLAVFANIGNVLVADRGFGFRVRATVADQDLLDRWEDVLAWWMQGPEAPLPSPDELRAWQRFVADNLEFRLGVAIGAVVAQAWSAGAANAHVVPSLAEWRRTTGLPWFGFWARELLRWGTHEPFVAFSLAQGLANTRETAAERREEFEAWLNEEYVGLEPENLIDPQLLIEWQASLPRQGHADAGPAPQAVVLTGTDGRRQQYSVLPAMEGGLVRWLDPAGFELARSNGRLREFGAAAVKDDFELRTDHRGSTVHKVFSASSRS